MRSQPPPRSAPEQLSGHAVEEAVLERRRRSVRFPDRGQVRESHHHTGLHRASQERGRAAAGWLGLSLRGAEFSRRGGCPASQ